MRLGSFVAGGMALVVASIAALEMAWGQATEPFRGKEISLLVGTGPAGGYDVAARIFARHYARFVPGNSTVLVRNVPGAGGLRLANQIYNVSPKDGTELGLFPTSVALEPLFHNKQAKYETGKFIWIGNMDSDSADGCGTWRHSGITSWADLKTRETTFGSAGPSGVSSINPRMIAAMLGLKTKVIIGYDSTHNVITAMQRGELDGSCALNLTATYAEFSKQIDAGDLNVWISFGRERIREFPNTPTIYELITSEEDRQLADLVFGQNRINRAISAPPGVSDDRVAILRTAFMATMSDKSFLADAAKANVTIHPTSGEETQGIYESFYKAPPDVVERAIKIMGRTEE